MFSTIWSQHFCSLVSRWLGEMVRTGVHQWWDQWRSWYFDPKSMPSSYFSSQMCASALAGEGQAQMSHNWCQIGGYLYDINYPWQRQRRRGRDYALSPPSYSPAPPTLTPPPLQVVQTPHMTLSCPHPIHLSFYHCIHWENFMIIMIGSFYILVICSSVFDSQSGGTDGRRGISTFFSTFFPAIWMTCHKLISLDKSTSMLIILIIGVINIVNIGLIIIIKIGLITILKIGLITIII